MQLSKLLQDRPHLSGENSVSSFSWNDLSNRRISLEDLIHRKPAQLPAFGALFHDKSLTTGGGVGVGTTIGCAVWPNLEGARERALLEPIERDAVAQSWYNRLGITRLSDEVLAENISVDLRNYLDGRQRNWWVSRIRTDLPAHVVVAFSSRRDGKMSAFGSSAGWDLSAAVMGAVCEMLQAENSLEMMQHAYPEDSSADAGAWPSALAYARTRSIIEDWPVAGPDPDLVRLSETVYSYDLLLEGLRQKDMTIWEFNATRPDLNVPCIKLFSPDLCTWQPRFGKRRLFQGVVEQGARAAPADEAEFAVRPFPF
jgi:ribosomal protein S12 methylthiotransferase accessory factor